MYQFAVIRTRILIAAIIWATIISGFASGRLFPRARADESADLHLSEISAQPAEPLEKVLSRHRFELGMGLHQFDYKEAPPPPRRSAESGLLPSVFWGYRYDGGPERPLFSAQFSGAIGVNTQYQGTNQTGKVSITDETSNRFLQGEFSCASPALIRVRHSELRAYGGAGYRYWRRGEEATDQGSYREDYEWPLLIAGALIRNQPTDRLSFDVDLSARWQVMGKMKVFLSELDSRLQDATVRLGSRVGFKAQLPMAYRFRQDTSLLLSPWFEYSSIGQSDRVTVQSNDGRDTGFALEEPSSRTLQYGSLIGVSFGI